MLGAFFNSWPPRSSPRPPPFPPQPQLREVRGEAPAAAAAEDGAEEGAGHSPGEKTGRLFAMVCGAAHPLFGLELLRLAQAALPEGAEVNDPNFDDTLWKAVREGRGEVSWRVGIVAATQGEV